MIRLTMKELAVRMLTVAPAAGFQVESHLLLDRGSSGHAKVLFETSLKSYLIIWISCYCECSDTEDMAILPMQALAEQLLLIAAVALSYTIRLLYGWWHL